MNAMRKKSHWLKRIYLEASSGDPWGDCMNAWFAVASELYWRGRDIPSEWEYSPGAALDDPREHDGFWFEDLERASVEELWHFGSLLCRHARILEKAGHSY